MGRIVAHRFELLEPIGQGGTGSVWVALDHERATLAAVKLLKHADAGGVVQFAREQAMRIRSEHVIAPYTWAAADEQVAIAMPLRTGGSLAVLVARSRRAGSRTSGRRQLRRSPPSMPPGSCTVTSPRPTCCSPRPAPMSPSSR